jgi:hypothetical protein
MPFIEISAIASSGTALLFTLDSAGFRLLQETWSNVVPVT